MNCQAFPIQNEKSFLSISCFQDMLLSNRKLLRLVNFIIILGQARCNYFFCSSLLLYNFCFV